MTKKDLNQNAKYDQELINIFDEQFIFGNKPINRFNNSNNINTPEILSKPKRLSAAALQIASATIFLSIGSMAGRRVSVSAPQGNTNEI